MTPDDIAHLRCLSDQVEERIGPEAAELVRRACEELAAKFIGCPKCGAVGAEWIECGPGDAAKGGCLACDYEWVLPPLVGHVDVVRGL